jgi:hypothetical protein
MLPFAAHDRAVLCLRRILSGPSASEDLKALLARLRPAAELSLAAACVDAATLELDQRLDASDLQHVFDLVFHPDRRPDFADIDPPTAKWNAIWGRTGFQLCRSCHEYRDRVQTNARALGAEAHVVAEMLGLFVGTWVLEYLLEGSQPKPEFLTDDNALALNEMARTAQGFAYYWDDFDPQLIQRPTGS